MILILKGDIITKKEAKAMILAIDIGNTNIALGGFEGETPSFVARISTDARKTSDEYAGIISSALLLYGVKNGDIDGAIISSVVPPLTSVIKNAVSFICGVEALAVGPGIKTGINIHCDDPSSVGADLICACVAVNKLYKSPALIIDMGTATKMTLTDKSGGFCGVSIIPGVAMGMKSLSEGTAQLPQVSLDEPRSVIGKNTADCMRSGVIFGNASLIDGMVERFFEAAGGEMPIYATGGLAGRVIKHCRHEIILDENLVLKGLYILFNKNK